MIKTCLAGFTIAGLSACADKAGETPAEEMGLDQKETADNVARGELKEALADAGICADFGPQTPRDINSVKGMNAVSFRKAPPASEMNLCNIHFHRSAEHRAAAFNIYAGQDGDNGQAGYQCGISKTLSEKELRPVDGKVCKGLAPGDTIEVHWVHSSCPVAPGKGLGSCLSDGCDDPDLRVETQVFTLVNDSSALNFMEMGYDKAGHQEGSFHQAKMLPDNTGKPVEFLGSTTGPSYNDSTCSPMKVNWSVRPQCAKLDINSIASWCEGNVFKEDHAHGVRSLVTRVELLSPIN